MPTIADYGLIGSALQIGVESARVQNPGDQKRRYEDQVARQPDHEDAPGERLLQPQPQPPQQQHRRKNDPLLPVEPQRAGGQDAAGGQQREVRLALAPEQGPGGEVAAVAGRKGARRPK